MARRVGFPLGPVSLSVRPEIDIPALTGACWGQQIQQGPEWDQMVNSVLVQLLQALQRQVVGFSQEIGCHLRMLRVLFPTG